MSVWFSQVKPRLKGFELHVSVPPMSSAQVTLTTNPSGHIYIYIYLLC